MAARAGYSPAIAGQVHSDKAGLGSSWEVSQGPDQQGPWPGTGMAVAELETGTPTA